MVKKYTLLSNEQREELCRLIHDEGLTIKEASVRTGVPYPNAKAVNKTFERERRTDKRHAKVHRFIMPPRIINIPSGKRPTLHLMNNQQPPVHNLVTYASHLR